MNSQLQEKLKEVAELANNELGRADFEAAFAQLVSLVKQIDQKLNAKIETLFRDAEQRLNQQIEHPSYVEDIRKKIEDHTIRLTDDVSKRLNATDYRLSELMAVKLPDAKSVAKEASQIAENNLRPLIPIVEAVEEKIPKMGIAIRDALSLLDEEEKLEMDAIKGLLKVIEELRELIRDKMLFVGGGGGGRVVKSYDISSSLDGATKTFSLPSFWRVISIHLSSFPNILRETTDYIVDGSARTITFTDAIDVGTSLASGQSCIVVFSE